MGGHGFLKNGGIFGNGGRGLWNIGGFGLEIGMGGRNGFLKIGMGGGSGFLNIGIGGGSGFL